VLQKLQKITQSLRVLNRRLVWTHYKGDWWWHGAAVVSWVDGLLTHKLFPIPKGTPGDYANLLMVAHKPDVSH
jgi:hypothetical protein